MGACFKKNLCIVLFSCQTSRICVSVRRETSIFPASLPPPPPPIFSGTEPEPRLCCPLPTRAAKYFAELGGGGRSKENETKTEWHVSEHLRKTQLWATFYGKRPPFVRPPLQAKSPQRTPTLNKKTVVPPTQNLNTVFTSKNLRVVTERILRALARTPRRSACRAPQPPYHILFASQKTNRGMLSDFVLGDCFDTRQ